MGEIDSIENKLFLTKDSIDFKEVVDEFLGENPPEEEIDKLEFRKAKTDALLYRFKTIYGLDILEPQDGCSVFNVKKEDEYLIKRCLHRFLVHKSKRGGTGASSDGSGKLFEEISANAVKNFLGENAKSILTGEAGDNLSPEFLKKITTTLQEKEGVYHNLPPQAKDDGG